MSDKCQIFLSYRRSDAGGHARALHRDLIRRFGPAQIFFDRSNIQSGDRFGELLQASVKACQVLVALIGPDWLDVKDAEGRRRLDIIDDFVRQEIALALELSKTVLPVLFDDAPMPKAKQLPEPLKPLAKCDAFTLRGKTYEYDRQIEKLTQLLQKHAPDLHLRASSLVKGYDALFGKHELFAGRGREMTEMDAFVDGLSQGHLFVTGRSGSGKTALMVNWVRSLLDSQNVYVAYHFLSRDEGTASEEQMLRSLVQQLIIIHDYSETVPVALDELRVEYAKLIEEDSLKRPLVVAVDGLDEVEGKVPWPRHFPAKLPNGVFLVFSARAIAEMDWLKQLGLQGVGAESIDLDKRNLNDEGVRELLLAAGGQATDFAAAADKVHELTTRSAGDPLLLRFLVEDVAAGTFEKVPTGLENYLDNWWEAISESATEELSARHLLGYLVVARGRLTREDLIAIGPQKILDGFALDRSLKSMRRFILGDRRSGYVLCHPRFQNYIASNVIGGDRSFHERILAFSEQWAENKSRYALSAYPRHLLAAAGEGTPQQREETFTRLVKVLTNLAFQNAYMEKVGDFGAFQQNLRYALRNTPEGADANIISGVMRLAFETEAMQRTWLDPEAIFQTAASGDPSRAEEMLRPFGPEPEWRQLTYAVIAWLASRSNADAGQRFLAEHAADLDPAQMWYSLLLERLRALLAELEEPPLIIPYAGPFGGQPLPMITDLGLARALVARIGGQLGENISGFDYEALRAGPQSASTFSNMGHGPETPTYVVENDSPQLVAVAVYHTDEGMKILQQYIAIHGANPYRVYRNRSLYGIAGAAICHPDLEIAMDLLQTLIKKAFLPGGAEYRESLLIASTALAAADGDTEAIRCLNEMRKSAQEAATQLNAERGNADSWGHHSRRLGMLAEAYYVALNDLETAGPLLEQARGLPFGYAGFQAPASLALAESIRICQPKAEADRSEVLERALRSAHKVQEPPFCAATTARVNAMIERWWQTPINAVDKVVQKLHEDLDHQDFTALHIVGEAFKERGENDLEMLPIPQQILNARSLQDIARNIYRLPVTELARVNPDMDPAEPQVDGTQVYIPDPSLTPLLAARLAAEVVAERDGFEVHAPALLVKTVSAAIGNPTALNIVLARMLLALGITAGDAIATARELAPKEWMKDPAKPPLGVPT